MEFPIGAIHDYTSLAEALTEIAPSLTDFPCDLIPTSFDGNDERMRSYPRTISFTWSSVHSALQHFKATGVIMRLPLFYQLEPALFRAARSAGAFIFVNDQENMPVGAMAIADGSMDVVVTTQKDSVVFSQFLTERSLQLPRAWIVLHRADQPWELPAALLSPAARVAQEVHLFPGLPVLTQCPALIDAKAPRFHAAAGMAVNPLKTGARVSGPMGDPVPLSEYQLNIPLSESGMCACGLPVYALTATK